jgi:hypothetical protein
MKTRIGMSMFLGVVVLAGGVQAQSAVNLVWVDATGVGVGPYNANSFYVDDDGFIWFLDPERGTLSDEGIIPRYFLEADCVGTPYVAAFGFPRIVFRVPNRPGRWVRADAEQAQTRRPVSVDNGAGCVLPYDTGPSVPESSLKPAPDNLPIFPFVPPFHVERR